MTSFDILDTKNFMQALFRSSLFDDFAVCGVMVTTFTSFEITGKINKDFYDEEVSMSNCLWSELKPLVFNLVKGKRPPKNMKIIFSAPENLMPNIYDTVSAFFINIIFDSSGLKITTGCSYKDFSLDLRASQYWDECVKDFLENNGFSVSTH